MAEIVRERDINAARRRSTRVAQALPIIVRGWNEEGRAFQEQTFTISINCYGCRFQSKHCLSSNSWVFLEIPHRVPGRAPRNVRARVTWVTRPRTDHERYQVGVELETHGNIWGMAFPPEDWFPYPETPEEASRTVPPNDAGQSKLKVVNQIPAAAPGVSSSGLTASEGEEAQDPNGLWQQVAHIVAEAKRQIEKELASHLQLAAETQRKILDQELESAVKRGFSEIEKQRKSAEARAREAIDRLETATEKAENLCSELSAAVAKMPQNWEKQIQVSLQDGGPRFQQMVETATSELRREAEQIEERLKEIGNSSPSTPGTAPSGEEASVPKSWSIAGDAAIEDFKKRLENVANSWLVTTAAILNERAHDTLAALAKATEDRLRDRSE
ncbi:MAG: hypothetical protein ACLQMT_11475 [Candidatus Acidiferrales bacterium]